MNRKPHLVTIIVLKRKPGMPVEAFQAYWHTTHAALVTKVPEPNFINVEWLSFVITKEYVRR